MQKQELIINLWSWNNMKEALLISALLMTLSASAQTIDDLLASTYAAQIHQDSIDQSTLVVTYDYRCNTLDSDGKAVTDTKKMCLQIGSHTTRFYPYCKYLEDTEGVDYLSLENVGNTYKESFTFIPEVWMNYPDGMTTVRDNILPNIFETRDDKVQIKWTLTDDTTTIGGHVCKTANALVHGKKWIVHYAEDIPSTAGPWKLNGLPGLILLAEDIEGIHSFGAEDINYVATPIFYEHNAITIRTSEKELIKQRNKIFGNRLYAKNPLYYIDRNTMYKDVDEVFCEMDGKYFSLINGIIEKDKAHKYQPLELK